MTAKAGVQGGGFSVGAAWADYDRDGHLELFVARYAKTDVNHLPDPAKGFRDFLFRNRGDGTFEDLSEIKEREPIRKITQLPAL